MTPLVPIFLSFCRNIVAHWKIEAFALAVVTSIGLIANQFTAPKVLAVMVFLSDWNMRWSWEWWIRMIIGLACAGVFWLIERKRHGKALLAQKQEWLVQTRELRDELKHAQSLLSARDLELAVLRRK